MISRTAAVFSVTLVLAGVSAVADDAPSDKPIQTHKQLMKQCMTEQKAKASNSSADEMKKACEEKIKSYQNHPSSPTPDSAPHS